MPLYSLTCLALHYPTYAPLRALVHTSTTLVQKNGGLVRKIDYLGKRNTPHRIKASSTPGGVGEAEWVLQSTFSSLESS